MGCRFCERSVPRSCCRAAIGAADAIEPASSSASESRRDSGPNGVADTSPSRDIPRCRAAPAGLPSIRMPGHRRRNWHKASPPEPHGRRYAARASVWRYSGRMSGVFGQALGRKKSTTGGVVNSVKYLRMLHGSLRQVKYVYDCVNPSFAEAIHYLGPRERLGEKHHISGRAVLLLLSTIPRMGTAWCADYRRGKSGCHDHARTARRGAVRSTAPFQSSHSKSNG